MGGLEGKAVLRCVSKWEEYLPIRLVGMYLFTQLPAWLLVSAFGGSNF
jgi:hypothetical protein